MRELAAQPHWIMDGLYANSLTPRLARADTVIFLDLPRRVYLCRVLWRTFVLLGRERDDVGPGCREHVSTGLLNWVWNFPRRSRPRIVEQLRGYAGRTVILTSPRAARAFIAQLGR